METAALIASLVSIGIAIFAVSIAIVFFRMSTNLAEGIKDAAKDISSGVNRLEKIFDKLYADTFGMMRDAFTDMRKQLWSGEKVAVGKVSKETEKKAREKVEKLKADFQDQIKGTLSKQKITNEKYDALLQSLSKLAEKIIAYSRKVDSEAKEETVRNRLLIYLQRPPCTTTGVEAIDVVNEVGKKYKFDFDDVILELKKLKDEKIITFKGDLRGNTIIKLAKKNSIK